MCFFTTLTPKNLKTQLECIVYYPKCMIMKFHHHKKRTCKGLNAWVKCFRDSDFDVRNFKHPEKPKKFKDVKLQELLDANLTQMLLELSIMAIE